MNGQRKPPPDKGESNEMPFEYGTNDDLILNEIDIKQEAMVKEEPIDTDDNVVSISYAHTTGALSSPIDGIRVTGSADLNNMCDLMDIKSGIKAEEVTKKVDKVSDTRYVKDETGHKGAVKSTSSRGKANVRQTSGDRKIRNVAKAKKSNIKMAPITKADKKQHQCSSCQYRAKYESDLKKHIRKHTGEKPFPCTHCSKRFSRKDSLQQHIRTHVAEFMFSCSNCLKGFSQISEKLDHEVTYQVSRYECSLCNEYSTLCKTNLKRHMRVHTGDRPFRCDQCSKKFNQQFNLKRHMKTHTNPRPPIFKCSNCYMNFTQQAEKDEHEGNCKRRGYECYLCECFNSSKKPQLVYHMRAQHTGDKPFRYEICAKCFSHKGNFYQHKKIHK